VIETCDLLGKGRANWQFALTHSMRSLGKTRQSGQFALPSRRISILFRASQRDRLTMESGKFAQPARE
jgi:hypothetical protein